MKKRFTQISSAMLNMILLINIFNVDVLAAMNGTLTAPSSSSDHSVLIWISQALFGSIISGVSLGLVPLIVGLKKGRKRIAIGGFMSCMIGSLVLGLLLSLPICIIFTVIISVQDKRD